MPTLNKIITPLHIKLRGASKYLLEEIRVARGAKFLYLPLSMSVRDIFRSIYLEYADHTKSDMIIINSVIDELICRNILASNPVNYLKYELDNFTFYDINLKTSDNRIFCRGTSLDLSESYAKALGEVFERTSVKFNPEENVLIKSEEELKRANNKYVSIDEFAKPTQNQRDKYPNQNINKNDKFSYLKVRDLADERQEEYLIPAQSVHYRNCDSYRGEKVIIGGTSHGAGAYYNEEGAIDSAVYEIINRHYYLKSWYEMTIIRQIDIKSIPEELIISSLIKDLEKRGFDIRLIDYSEEASTPSIICVLIMNGGWYVGGTAGKSLDKVILRSLSEAFASYLWVMNTNLAGQNDISEEKIRNIKKGFLDSEFGTAFYKVLLFANRYYIENSLDFKNFINGPLISYDSLINKSDKSVQEIALKLPSKVYIKNIENTYLTDYGYNVVKAIAPSCYNLHLDEIDARPVIGASYPQNVEFNPFP